MSAAHAWIGGHRAATLSIALVALALPLAVAARGGDDAGWITDVGANSGPGPASTVEIESPGQVSLEGTHETRRWMRLSRRLPGRAGESLRVRGEARLVGARLDDGQRDNAYVGLGVARATDRVDVRSGAWEPWTIVSTRAEEGPSVWVFLSETGRLEVRGIEFDRLTPADAFPAILDHLERTYPFDEAKHAAFAARAEAARAGFAAATTPAAFLPLAKALLTELHDEHVWLQLDGGPRLPTYATDPPANGDVRGVYPQLRDAVRCHASGFAGRLGDDVGYVAFGSLAAEGPDQDRLVQAFVALLDRKGLLLDLRECSGGDERRALEIVGRLTESRVVYARRQSRAGPRITDLATPVDAVLEPSAVPAYPGPVVVLLGPRCASSGEGMAQMLAVLPHVRLVGLPTKGASGNPQPIRLPNGVTMWSSTWRDFLPDGTPLEGHGVPPDIRIDPAGRAGDPTFEEGLRLLRGRIPR